MPLLLGSEQASIEADFAFLQPLRAERDIEAGARTAPALEIGLLNNMPDAALQATERQFIRLLNAAARQRVVRLHFFSLPAVARSAEAKSRIEAVYSDFGDLRRSRLDGLIVTGAEPRTASLREEVYWPVLTEVIDWAAANTASTIWSCLAAHAAVLHLDGVERRRFPEKCSGVFNCSKAVDDPLTDGLAWPVKISHSRYNGLSEGDLSAHGYRVLTRAGSAGVDIFTKRLHSLFVFFQGHPEYDPLSLQREYRRDVARFLQGERNTYPVMPSGYFDAAARTAFETFRLRALAGRDPALLADFPEPNLPPRITSEAGTAATVIVANWLSYLAERRAS